MISNDEDLKNGTISQDEILNLSNNYGTNQMKSEKSLDLTLSNDETPEDTEGFVSDDLLTIINECNEALKELKDARNKLELQLEESQDYCNESFDSNVNGIVKSKYESFECDQNTNDFTKTKFNIEKWDNEDKIDLEKIQELNECDISSEGEALNSLTSNLEKLQSEIDYMIEELMKDEQAAMLAISEFMDNCDTKPIENKEETLKIETCEPQA